MADNIFWLWLMNLRGIGLKKKRCLLAALGSPEAVFEGNRETLAATEMLRPKELAALLAGKNLSAARQIQKFCQAAGVSIITPRDRLYPEGLKNLYTPPLGLFARGRLELLATSLKIGVVGARKATLSGQSQAQKFAEALSSAGVTVVSGMAEGIDSAGHLGALAGLGGTVAVMGTGIDRCYPAKNRALCQQIAAQGLLLTEFLPGERAAPYHFPLRNRIISGLSDGVLVVEAGEKSGAMITVDYALEQGKNIYAIPGDIQVAQKAGTNRLIKEGAKLVTSPSEILEDFFPPSDPKTAFSYKKSVEPSMVAVTDENQRLCLKQIALGYDTLDTLALVTGLEIRQVNVAVSMLELSGVVRVAHGKIILL